MKLRTDFTYEDLRDIYALLWIFCIACTIMATIAKIGGLL